MDAVSALQTIRVVLDVTVDDDQYSDYYSVPVPVVGPKVEAKIVHHVGRIVGVKQVIAR